MSFARHVDTLLNAPFNERPDIKRAYRNKARDTHPDKQRGKASPEVAATAFRAVVQAYEVLSDKNSRRNYDKSGIIPGEPGASPQRQRSSWSWGFHSDTSRTSRGQHKYLSDRVRREHIRDAQSRVIGIRSLDQLKSFIVTDGAQAQVTERYTLLSLFDSSLNGCEQLLRDEVLFPWPFAGYNYEGVQSGGMWWEEIVAVGQVDFAGGSNDLIEIATFFGVHQTLRCPTIVMIPRGISVEDIGYHFKILKEPKSAEEFMQWVWPLLKMNIFFVNKSPFPLRFYWLDGSRGKELSVVNVDETYAVNTFISHSFYARADFVDGRILTNEVCVTHTIIFANDLLTAHFPRVPCCGIPLESKTIVNT